MEKVILPEKLVRLNEDTFSNCANLKEIVLRSTSTTVNHNAYRNSPLAEVKVEPIIVTEFEEIADAPVVEITPTV